MDPRKYLWLSLLLPVLILSGCAPAMVGLGAGAGFGTYSYVKGELTVLYPYSYDQTWNASVAAMEKLEIEVTSQQRDALSGHIKGKRNDGKSVLIRIADKGTGVTEVGVRVGSFGDQEASRKIQKTISNILKG